MGQVSDNDSISQRVLNEGARLQAPPCRKYNSKSRHEPSRSRTALMQKERDSCVEIPALVL